MQNWLQNNFLSEMINLVGIYFMANPVTFDFDRLPWELK